MDKETAYQVVRDENRRLTELVAALSSSSPPLPPPVPGPPPAPAELRYAAYARGSAPWDPITFHPAVLPSSERLRSADASLAAKRPRRTYGESTKALAGSPPASAAFGAPLALNQAIEALLRAHALDWAPTQRQNCRTYLLSPSGRFQQWCAAQDVGTIDDLTTAAVAAFLEAMLNAASGPGLRASTVAKFRGHLRSLARFQATTPGFGSGLRDTSRPSGGSRPSPWLHCNGRQVLVRLVVANDLGVIGKTSLWWSAPQRAVRLEAQPTARGHRPLAAHRQ